MGNKRRIKETEHVRETILNAARELFVKHGHEAVTMRMIAKAIDYAPGAIYFHFKDKEALIREMCMQDLAALTAAIRQQEQLSDPVEQLKVFMLGYARWGIEHPNHYRLMLMSPCPGYAAVDEQLQGIKGNPEHDGYALLLQTVQGLIDRKLLRPELKEASLVAQCVWGAVHGVVALEITHRNDPWFDWQPIEKRLRTVLDCVIGGMLRNAAGARTAKKVRA